MSKLQGKVAFITGSTSGIGLGMAKVLASNDYYFALNIFSSLSNIVKIERLSL